MCGANALNIDNEVFNAIISKYCLMLKILSLVAVKMEGKGLNILCYKKINFYPIMKSSKFFSVAIDFNNY